MEKGGERNNGEKLEDEEEKFMGIKLKRGILVGKRGGPCTPPPTWTLGPSSAGQEEEEPETHKGHNPTLSSVSARQLGANLWENLPHLQKLSNMEKGGGGGGSRRRYYQHDGGHENKGLQIQTVVYEDPLEGDCSAEQPGSSGSFHRQIAASLMRHHRSVGKNGPVLPLVSPATYSSSMEVTPYNPTGTPSSSLDFRGRIGESGCSLKTSTELLKVLNRIWSLEEQHVSNTSLVKALKMELDNSRARTKELLKEKQMDRQVIDGLMKKVMDDKLLRKNLEQDRTKSALQSVMEELEGEKKLRKRSESLHRKLARDLSDMKSSFNKVVNEYERERNTRVLLGQLCDEFAMGIRDYEQELRLLKQSHGKDQVCREPVDSLVLHISEAWLDQRMQMKLADGQSGIHEKDLIVDKLGSEIIAFLKARRSLNSSKVNHLPSQELRENCLRRQSLESFHVNEMTSAPKDADDDDDDSIDSESNCFELNKTSGLHNGDTSCQQFGENTEKSRVQEKDKMNTSKKKIDPRIKGRGLSSLQARFQQHMTKTLLSNGKSMSEADNPDEVLHASQRSEIQVDGSQERKSKRFGSFGPLGGNSNHMAGNFLLRNNSSSIEGEKIHPEDSLASDSHGHLLLAGPASPVKMWESKITMQDPDISESSSKSTSATRENTLKAKLLEARLEGRHSHLRPSKGFI